jgi:hypothetical protein
MVTKASSKSEETNEGNAQPSAEVSKPTIQWGQIDNIADARNALENAGVAVIASNVLFGDGSEFIQDKSRLVGTPFLVLDWRFIIDEETKREYVNVLVMNPQGAKARFNDGSTGVYQQLKQVTEQAGIVAIECRLGLRKSDYTYTNDKGETSKAVTYYLSA